MGLGRNFLPRLCIFLMTLLVSCNSGVPPLPGGVTLSVSGVKIGDQIDSSKRVLDVELDTVKTVKWRKKHQDSSHKFLEETKTGAEFLFNRQEKCCLIFSDEIQVSTSNIQSTVFREGDDIKSLSQVLGSVPVRKEISINRPLFVYDFGFQRLVVYTFATRSYLFGILPMRESVSITGFHLIDSTHDESRPSACGRESTS